MRLDSRRPPYGGHNDGYGGDHDDRLTRQTPDLRKHAMADNDDYGPDFNSSDIEFDEPAAPDPYAHAGLKSIEKMLETAAEDRIKSKQVVRQLKYVVLPVSPSFPRHTIHGRLTTADSGFATGPPGRNTTKRCGRSALIAFARRRFARASRTPST